MALSWEKLEPLVNAAMTFKDKRLQVDSSLGRHSALSFTFDVDFVGVGFSGMKLMLLGSDANFSFSLRDVSSFSIKENGEIEIVEQFEQKTERTTSLRITE